MYFSYLAVRNFPFRKRKKCMYSPFINWTWSLCIIHLIAACSSRIKLVNCRHRLCDIFLAVLLFEKKRLLAQLFIMMHTLFIGKHNIKIRFFIYFLVFPYTQMSLDITDYYLGTQRGFSWAPQGTLRNQLFLDRLGV